MKTKQELRIIIGQGAYKDGKNDYMGKVGIVEISKGKLRVQFIGIANNEPLQDFNLDVCQFFIKGATNQPHAIVFTDLNIKKHFSELGKKSWEKRKASLLQVKKQTK